MILHRAVPLSRDYETNVIAADGSAHPCEFCDAHKLRQASECGKKEEKDESFKALQKSTAGRVGFC